MSETSTWQLGVESSGSAAQSGAASAARSIWARLPSSLGTLLIVWLVFAATAVSLVYCKHLMTQRVTELQALYQERDQLQMQWRQLMIEQSTWGLLSRVEHEAKTALEMTAPQGKSLVVLKQ